MTELHRRVVAAVRKWHQAQPRAERILSIRHVHPRCYIIAQTAQQCLVVAVPRVDRERHLQASPCQQDFETIRVFDAALSSCQWCSTAYVMTASSGQPVAIKVVA